MKNSKKTLIIISGLIILIFAFGIFFVINKRNTKNEDVENVNTTQNVEENRFGNESFNNTLIENKIINNSIENSIENAEKSENNEQKKITISDDEIIDILIDTDPFESVTELSTDNKLAIIYKALNENKINAYKNRGNGQATVEFTEGEINGIVYSLFGVELGENKSYGSVFKYENGKYILHHSDKDEGVPIAKNVERDVAAGTSYTNYDLYYKKDGKEVLKGSYAIGKSNVTGFVNCKKEM